MLRPRRLVLAALCFLVAVASAALWARSRVMTDEIGYAWQTPDGSRWMWAVRSTAGTVGVLRHGVSAHVVAAYRNLVPTPGLYHESIVLGDPPATARAAYWQLVLLFTAAPALYLLARRRWLTAARRARGQCERCGYDLRATPDRCPECGTSATTATTATP